jgi:YCII-related domain
MPQFIFSYRSAKSYDALADPDGVAAWGAFLNGVIAPSVVDPGWPVFEPAAVLGEAGQSTQLGGYSIVTADDLDTALSMARHCPTIERGGGVEVAVLAALPPEHPAEQIRSRLAKA